MSELPIGRGTFLIKRVFTTDKETGNPLLARSGIPKVLIIIEVKDEKGRTASVYEHLVEKGTVDWKRDAIALACGEPGLFSPASNVNAERLERLSGDCIIGSNEWQGELQPVIDKYYPAKIEPVVVEIETVYDDELPF